MSDWAQSSDKVYLTVELPDAKNAQVKLEPDGSFTFTATSKHAKYETELQLYGRVKVDKSKINEGRCTVSATVGTNNLKFETDLKVFAPIEVMKHCRCAGENEVGRVTAVAESHRKGASICEGELE